MHALPVEACTPVPGKKTVVVRVGGIDYEVAADVARRLDLAPGGTVGQATLQEIVTAARRRAAAAQALRYLARRPRTRHEVREHLEHKGYEPEVVAALLEELQASGLVDDARYAAWYVRARLGQRPSGAARLRRELRERGVPEAAAAAAVAAAFEDADEFAWAREAAKKRLPSLRGLQKDRALRRLAGFLERRGFGSETVRRVCFEVLGTDTASDGPAAGDPNP